MKMVISTEPQASLCNAQFFNESQELHIELSDSKCSAQYRCQAKNRLCTTSRNQILNIEKLSNFLVDEKQNQTKSNKEEQPLPNISGTRTQLFLIFILTPILFVGVLVYFWTIGKNHCRRHVIEEEIAPRFLNRVSTDPLNITDILHQDDHILSYDENRWEYPLSNLTL